MRHVGTFALVLCAVQAQAATGSLTYDLRYDIPITAVGTVTWVGSELLKPHLAPAACRWCDGSLNGLDNSARGLRWSDTRAADTASNITSSVLAPLWALGMTALAAGHEDAWPNVPVDALVIAEAVVLAGNLNQLVKFTAARQRPFIHFLPESERLSVSHPDDNNLSFYSAHTNFTFSLATAAGTVAWMRGYRWAPWIWGVGAVIAGTTGYLRIAADRHYFTDVLTGALVGTAVGFSIPYFFHRGQRPLLSVVPRVGGVECMFAGTW